MVLHGSIKTGSSNHRLVSWLQGQELAIILGKNARSIQWNIFDIAGLPFFNPDMDHATTDFSDAGITTGLPASVADFREQLAAADGLLVCTPEYVFSLPGVLKNALEWLVSTTLLTDKPTALITAAASGEKAQQQLHLLMQTLGARFSTDTTLLIKGVAGKMERNGDVKDPVTRDRLGQLLEAFMASMPKNTRSRSPE